MNKAIIPLHTVSDLAVVPHSVFIDKRGSLVPIELSGAVPFSSVRLFWVCNVPNGATRGGHAHRKCAQYLICMKGQIEVETTDGNDVKTHVLEMGSALYLPPMIWGLERYVTADAVLLVLCDHPYDRDDYIDDVDDLRQLRVNHPT